MANKYVYSGAGGAGTGVDWANAYTTLALAIAGSAAGDDLWVANDHAESTAASIVLTFPGTSASPNRIICVNRGGSVPPVSADLTTTGTVTTTGVANISFHGVFWCEGLTFSAGSGANAGTIYWAGTTSGSTNTFKNCNFTLGNTSASSIMGMEAPSGSLGHTRLINCVLTFGSTSQRIQIGRGRFRWENTASAIGGATFPTALFNWSTAIAGNVHLIGVDLSALSTGKTIVSSSSPSPSIIVLQDCKLDGSVTIAATPTHAGGEEVYVIRSASTGIAYTQNKYDYRGTETMETTIVRTGGASINGTSISKKYVTTANAKFYLPFISTPIAVANSITASNRVVNVYGIWGGGAVPDNDDIWFEVEYLGSAASPQGTFKSTAKADVLATASSHSTDTSTWGGSTTPFKMTTTLSSPQPAMAGEMYIRIYCGAASSTFYIDPKVELA